MKSTNSEALASPNEITVEQSYELRNFPCFLLDSFLMLQSVHHHHHHHENSEKHFF